MHKLKLIFFVMFLLLSCSKTEQKMNEVQLNTSNSDITSISMREQATVLVSTLMGKLKSEMMSAIKEGGYENAIHTCQIKAPLITDSLTTKSWSVKRVTNKPRNLNNLLSEDEQEIFALFADSINKIEYVDKWGNPDVKDTYTFYKPIYMGKLCLKCHGTNETLDQKAIMAIQKSYPEDKAVDYKEGDLRGMFVVKIENKASLNSTED